MVLISVWSLTTPNVPIYTLCKGIVLSTSCSRNLILTNFNMPSNLTKISKPKRNRTNENFSKCIKSLLEKSNNLTQYHADVYLLIRRKSKLWEYKSLDCKCWPLSSSAIVSFATERKISSAYNLFRRITILYRPRKRLAIILRKGRLARVENHIL
jgi:hypothetical protein